MKNHKSILLLSLVILITSNIRISGQTATIYGYKGYIEYLPGNMPIVISIPHGGYQLPDEVEERPCVNCSKNQDIFTIEIGLEMRDAIFRETGHYPYIIINNLHRTRLDPNRNITEAADGNPIAELAWSEFQGYIDSAITEVQLNYGKGLYIDLHGHRHPIKRVELGYLLSSEELQLDNDFLDSDTFIEYSSFRNLAFNNIKSLSLSELVRGRNSIGTLLEEKGYQSIPSMSNPAPAVGEPFFPGGYNTMRHGSSGGGTVDGVQVEIDLELRSDPVKRIQFARDLSSVIITFLKTNYFPGLDFKEPAGDRK